MVQSRASSVNEYLAALPADRRAELSAVRRVILENLDPDIEEVMQYGMIGYAIPHSVYPPGYHCDPRQPLCYAGLASQKQHMSLYLMCCYGSPEWDAWFRSEWARSGKKLDMGKSCIRFRKADDLALDVIAETLRRVTARKFIDATEAILAQAKVERSRRAGAKAAKKKTAATPTKASTKKSATKASAKKSAAKRGATTTKRGATTAKRGATTTKRGATTAKRGATTAKRGATTATKAARTRRRQP